MNWQWMPAAVLCLAGMAVPAAAQRSHGYWFVAPGGATNGGHTRFALHMGGGGEVALGRGVALGLEAGAWGLPNDFVDSVIGIASLNGTYHFLPSRDDKWDPFATAGYSLAFRSGTRNMVNYGGGFNYWFQPSVAVRVEFRDHYSDRLHLWGFRFGLSFRDLMP